MPPGENLKVRKEEKVKKMTKIMRDRRLATKLFFEEFVFFM